MKSTLSWGFIWMSTPFLIKIMQKIENCYPLLMVSIGGRSKINRDNSHLLNILNCFPDREQVYLNINLIKHLHISLFEGVEPYLNRNFEEQIYYCYQGWSWRLFNYILKQIGNNTSVEIAPANKTVAENLLQKFMVLVMDESLIWDQVCC